MNSKTNNATREQLRWRQGRQFGRWAVVVAISMIGLSRPVLASSAYERCFVSQMKAATKMASENVKCSIKGVSGSFDLNELVACLSKVQTKVRDKFSKAIANGAGLCGFQADPIPQVSDLAWVDGVAYAMASAGWIAPIPQSELKCAVARVKAINKDFAALTSCIRRYFADPSFNYSACQDSAQSTFIAAIVKTESLSCPSSSPPTTIHDGLEVAVGNLATFLD